MSMGLIGYTAQSISEVETDVNRYYYVFQGLATVESFRDFALTVYLEGEINPVFQLVNFILARLFPENPQVLPFFWVTITYFFAYLTYLVLTDISNSSERKRLAFVLLIVFAGVVYFARTTETFKQCSSVALFGYALARTMAGKGKNRGLIVVSILVHVSSIMLLPIYWSLKSHIIKKYLLVIFVICLLLSVVNYNEVLALLIKAIPVFPEVIVSKVTAYEEYEVSGSIRILSTFFVFGMMIGLLAWHFYKSGNDEEKPFLIMQVMALCILLINRGNAHSFMRYIYSYFPFVGLAYFRFTAFRDWKKNEYFALHLAFALFLIYSNISYMMYFTDPASNYANSYIGGSVSNLLSYNVMDYLTYKVKL